MFGRMLSAEGSMNLAVAILAATATVNAASPAQILQRKALADRDLVPRFVTSSAAPVERALTSATGTCSVHVRQYQKQNPTGDYQLEATLYDRNQKILGSTQGPKPAPDGQPVLVSGTASPFTITAYAVDTDELHFTFGDDSWSSNSSQCRVGRFNSGRRDMDCTFPC